MGKNTPEEFEETNKEPGLIGDIRAMLSQLKYAKNLLKYAPDLDDIVNYGFPSKLKYAGRKENIEKILKAAEKRGYVEVNENEEYKITKKGGRLSSFGYVKEE